jgi:hypothetical protein
MVVMSDSPGHVHLDEQGWIDEDIACVECQYNLRALDPADGCPECGQPIAESLRAARWGFLTMFRFEVLVTAFTLWVVAQCGVCVLALDVLVFGGGAGVETPTRTWVIWTVAVGSVGGGFVYMVATEPAHSPWQLTVESWRVRLELMAAVGLAIVGAAVLLSAGEALDQQTAAMAGMVMWTSSVLSTTIILLCGAYLPRMRWLSVEQLAVVVGLLAWMIGGMIVLCAVTGAGLVNTWAVVIWLMLVVLATWQATVMWRARRVLVDTAAAIQRAHQASQL